MKRLAIVLLAVSLSGCRPHVQADAELCDAILQRIVDLELEAMGYHDPALAGMKRKQLHETLKGSLNSCIGRSAPKRALMCVKGAMSMAELTHDCLAL